MAWVKSRALLVLIAVVITFCSGYKKCKQVHSTSVDKEWILETGSGEGFHIPMHSNCDNCKKNEAWKWLTGRHVGEQESLCWNADVLTRYGPLTLPFNCKYFLFEEWSCVLDTSRLTKMKRKNIGYGAEHKITLTDNKTFTAGTSCIYGKENWWWVASVTEELDEDVEERIKEHFTDMGFKPDNLAVKGNWRKSPVIFKKFTLSDGECVIH